MCSFVCFRRPSARWVFLVIAGCLGSCSCAAVFVLLVRARWPALRLGVCLLGFPALVCAVTPVLPIASLCNVFSESGPSQGPSILSVTAQLAGAGVSGLRHWRLGVAPAPRFQLYVHYVAPCRARCGCRAPVSLSGASMAQGAVSCESGV